MYIEVYVCIYTCVFTLLCGTHIYVHVNIFMQCCLDNNIPGIELLLECNANINIQDDDFWTPLHVAAACGYRDMVLYLLEHNADCTLLDVDGNFAYDVADDPEIQRPLIKYMEFHGKCTCTIT